MKLLRRHILIIALLFVGLHGIANDGKPLGENNKLADNTQIFWDASVRSLVVELSPELVSSTEIYVFNVAFGKVYNGKATSVNNKIDLNTLPSGLYYVRLRKTNSDDTHIKKIIIS